MDLKQATIEAMDGLLAFVKDSPWREQYFFQVEGMRAKLDKPCVLAVAGRVKAVQIMKIDKGHTVLSCRALA